MNWLKAMIPDEYEVTAAEGFWVVAGAVGFELLQVAVSFEPAKIVRCAASSYGG